MTRAERENEEGAGTERERGKEEERKQAAFQRLARTTDAFMRAAIVLRASRPRRRRAPSNPPADANYKNVGNCVLLSRPDNCNYA